MISHIKAQVSMIAHCGIPFPGLVVALVLLMSFQLSGLVQAQELLWAKQVGGLGNEEGSGIVDSAGNSYVGGGFEGSVTFGSGETNETILTSLGLRDAFLAKYDESGNLIWAKRSGGVNDARAGGVLVNDLGHLYSGGEFEGSATFGLGENNETTLTAAGGGASWFGRFDPTTGALLWVKKGILSDSPGFGFDNLGNISITGSFEDMVTFGLGEPNETTLTSTGTGDIFVAKLNLQGELIAAKQVSGVGHEESRVVIDEVDNVYVFSRFVGSLTLGLGEINETMLTALGNGDVFLAKFNSNGELVWAKHVGGTGDEGIDGIEIDGVGNSYVIGGFGIAAGVGEMITFRLGEANPITLTSQGSGDIFIAKYDLSGNLLWVKQAGGEGFDDIEGLTVDPLGNAFVLGSFGNIFGSPFGDILGNSITIDLGGGNPTTLNSAGLRDLYIAKYDQNGNLLWARSDGGLGDEESADISVDNLGHSYATGYFTGSVIFGSGEVNQTTLPSAGGTDFFIAKFSTSGNFTLDVDDNGVADALTDGMLILRYLFGFKSEGLVNGVLALDATRTTPEEILAYLDSIRDILLDVDGNGKTDAFTDGMLIARFLMGFTGDSLINGVIDPSGNRTSAEAIQGFLTASLPDTTAPIISITSPLSGSQVNNDVITVMGIVDDPTATVQINGVLAILSGNSFTAEGVSLVPGENTIQATATDPSGNTASDSVQVTFLPVTAVTGTVLDPKGAPVFDALVTTNTGESTLSGADGTFFIANVQIGIEAIQVQAEFMVNGVTHHGNSTNLVAVVNGITDVGAITIVPPGTGTFLAPAHLAAGLGPRKIVTDDLNHDGFLDLAVANSVGKSVGVWQGQGDGLFNNIPNLNFETSLHSLVIEKFDNDDHYDIGVSRAQPGPFGGENSLSGITCVRLGDGAFGFGPETCVPHPSALALESGDLNRDGSPDAVAGLKALTAMSLMFGRPTGLLNSSSNILVGNGITDDITSLAIKDIDQDGFLDVAVTSQRAQQVNVLWGNGNGGFSGLDVFSAGTLPTAVTVADFNNDAILDLAVANQGSHDVSVLMGDGARGFLAPMHYPVGTDPVAIVALDFDNDGITDVGTANKGSNDVSLLLNDPLNGFFPPINLAVGTSPVSLAAGDFNRDGIQDVAVANEGSQNLSILLGIPVENNPPTVKITFPPLNHAVIEGSSQQVSIEATDDVAVSKVELLIDGLVVGEDQFAPYQFDVFIPLGVSQISFQARATDISDNVTFSEVITCIVLPDDPPTVNIAAPLQAANLVEGSTVPFTILANDNIGVVSVDFLIDGQVVFTDTTIPYTFDLLVPNGVSTIALGATATDTTGRAGVAPGIIVNVVPISFTTLLGTVVDFAGNPFAGAQVTAADNVASITDTHGRFSISGALASLGIVQAQASLIDSGIVYRGISAVVPANAGATTHVGPIHLAFGNLNAFDTGGFGPSAAVAGKINGDDNLDLVVTNLNSGTVAVLMGDGTGVFSSPTTFTAGIGPNSLVLADFNLDGKLDVAIENLDISETTASVVSIMLGDGLGGFSNPVDLLPGVGGRSIAADDFNKDGNPDLAVARERDNTLSVLLGNGQGEFSPPTTLDVGFRPVAVEVGHFNNDTNLDLAVSKLSGQGVSILLGDGLGGFTLTSNSVPCCGTDLALGDFNHDGFLDVVLSNSFVQGISIWFGDGTGGLSGPNDLDLGITALFGAPSIEAHQLNTDGHLDLVIANPTLGSTTVLFGEGEGQFSNPINFEGIHGTFEQITGDVNNDGVLDIIAPQFFDGTVGISLGLRSTQIDTIPPTIQITSPLSQSNVLEGNILPITIDAADDVGVKHITISVNGGVVFTGAAPPYNFDFNVPPGSTSILLDAQATDLAGNMTSATPVDVTVLLNSPTTIIGSVVNGNTLPVSNAEVTTTLGPGGLIGPSVLTNPDGSFTIPNVSSQAGNIVVRGTTTQNNQFLRGNSGSVMPVPNGITDVGQILLEEVVVPEIFLFTGTFTDGVGAPVPDLSINLFDPLTNRSASGVTDVNGIFTTTLGAGTYTLTAVLTLPGSFQSLDVLRVPDLPIASDTVQNFTTAPVVTLSGTIMDSGPFHSFSNQVVP